jgi:hypothetical protein
MRSNTVKREISNDWTDEELIEYFRESAIDRSRCGFNAVVGNRILDQQLVPCYQVLAERGAPALRKLLTLMSDDNANVRLEAATFAYDTDPITCRRTLQELIRKLRPVGLQAVIALLHKDADFSAEFERLAELGREQMHAQLAKRYGGYLE